MRAVAMLQSYYRTASRSMAAYRHLRKIAGAPIPALLRMSVRGVKATIR